jgi:glycosyltransferase involved in cell wall biosynthesis
MNVWILNHYAGTPHDPQITGSYDLGKELIKKGHTVTIFASSFRHRQLKDDRLRPGETSKIEHYDGVCFIWLKTFPYQRNDWRRVVNMLSYAWRSCWIGVRWGERPDVIIGTCPHSLAVAAAYVLSWLKRSRFFFEVRDLWAQTLVDSAVLSQRHPITVGLRYLEKFLFRRAERIITLLPHLYDYTRLIGIPDDRVTWIPNGVDLSHFGAIHKVVRKASDTFTLMYVGGFASYNSVSTILEAAALLQEDGAKEIKFVLVGSGPQKSALMQWAAEKQLRNVEFVPPVPKTDIPKVMEAADAFVYVVKNLSVLRYGLSPQKLYEYMAAGRPIVCAAAASNNPVSEAKAGLTVPPEKSEALAYAIRQLVAMSPMERERMGSNGFEHVKRYHDMAILGRRLEELIVAGSGYKGPK